MKESFVTIKPEDRYAFNIFETMATLGKYENHEDLLERVNLFEAMLWPIINSENSEYPGKNKKLMESASKDAGNPNPYAIARARLKLLMLEIERSGLIGGKGLVRFSSRKKKGKKEDGRVEL